MIRFDLLRALHTFISKRSAKEVVLRNVYNMRPYSEKSLAALGSTNCGAIACGMGWAALLPEFNAVGLGYKSGAGLSDFTASRDPEYACDDGSYSSIDYDEAAVKFIGVSIKGARNLFGSVGMSDYDYPLHECDEENGYQDITDQQFLLRRIEAFFSEHGESL